MPKSKSWTFLCFLAREVSLITLVLQGFQTSSVLSHLEVSPSMEGILLSESPHLFFFEDSIWELMKGNNLMILSACTHLYGDSNVLRKTSLKGKVNQ